MLNTVRLTAAWADDEPGMQLAQVAKLIAAREQLGAERAVFFAQVGGFDTHKDTVSVLAEKLAGIDSAFAAFKAEMVAEGVWEDVALVTVSEFGRTLTSNGAGTDHGWGGHHIILGGSVKGGTIHGEYPTDLTSASSLNVGRGRVIPTTCAPLPFFPTELDSPPPCSPARRAPPRASPATLALLRAAADCCGLLRTAG